MSTTTENQEKATQYREQAKESFTRADESFERCDTDGFLSQWANDLNGRLAVTRAKILENNGMAEFPALFCDGELVAAKLIHTRYGMRWGVLENDDPKSPVIQWLGTSNRALWKFGFTRGIVLAPAWASLDGNGTGLSGQVWISVYRKDGGFSRDVKVVTDRVPTKDVDVK